MKQIVKTIFGSHLYGTSTPESDSDFKAVHYYSLSEIVLKQPMKRVDVHSKTYKVKQYIMFEYSFYIYNKQ